jgi:hypothetical protein
MAHRSHKFFIDVYTQDRTQAEPYSVLSLENIRAQFSPLMESSNQDKTKTYSIYYEKAKVILGFPFHGYEKLLSEGQKIVVKSDRLDVIGIYLSVAQFRQSNNLVLLLGPFSDE